MNVLTNAKWHPGQLKVLNSKARWVVLLAGVRGGKTYSSAAAFLHRIFRDVAQGKVNDVPATGSRYRRPRYHAWVCAPTYDLLKEPWRYIEQLLPRELIEESYAGRELWIKGGILIEFKSTENAKALVSAGLHGMWLDEADRIQADAWRGQLSTRLADKRGWCLFSSTPYAARNGFLWQDFLSRTPEEQSKLGIEFITWKFLDNSFNSIEEYKFRKASTPEKYFRREYEASLDAFVGLVFELRDHHIVDIVPQPSAFKRVVAGVDWGWNAPGSIIVVGDTGDRLYVLDEHTESHLQVIAPPGERSWISEALSLRQKWNISNFVADPSGPQNINAFQRAGLPTVGAFNEILPGLRRVDEQMMLRPGQGAIGSVNYTPPVPGLQLHRNCKQLIREMSTLAWAVDKNGVTEEEPEPGNDHCIDALRYAVMELRRYPHTGVKAPSKRRATG